MKVGLDIDNDKMYKELWHQLVSLHHYYIKFKETYCKNKGGCLLRKATVANSIKINLFLQAAFRPEIDGVRLIYNREKLTYEDILRLERGVLDLNKEKITIIDMSKHYLIKRVNGIVLLIQYGKDYEEQCKSLIINILKEL